MRDAHPRQVVDEILAGLLGEYRAEMVGAHIHHGCDGMQRDVLVGEIRVDILLRLVDHRMIPAPHLRFPEIDDPLEEGADLDFEGIP